jgi:hypothetical protein
LKIVFNSPIVQLSSALGLLADLQPLSWSLGFKEIIIRSDLASAYLLNKQSYGKPHQGITFHAHTVRYTVNGCQLALSDTHAGGYNAPFVQVRIICRLGLPLASGGLERVQVVIFLWWSLWSH